MVAVGDVWEGHEILSELERGMVRTYLARQAGEPGNLVSLHLLEGARIEPDVFRSELQRLQEIARQLPEIVPVLCGGIVDGVAWAASPVLREATPVTDATRGSNHGPTTLKVLIDIGNCLVRAHELDLIHGALSPARVFLASDGRYAITHFGFVRLFQLDAEEARHDPYAPPELISGGPLGRRTDVYGLGAVMYELLCKRTLSPATWPPSFPIGIPPLLQGMMKKALTEDPRERQSSVRKMLTALAPFVHEWEELEEPPEAPHLHLFAEPSGSRRKTGEIAPTLGEGDGKPAASGEQVGRVDESPTLRTSEAPDTLKSVTTPRNDVTTIQAPPVAPRLPSAPDLPALEPVLPAPPPSSPPGRSRGTRGRRSPAHLLGAVLALAFLLGSAGAVLLGWKQPPRGAAAPLARVVLAAAHRSSTPPPPRPSDAPQASPTPVVPRPITYRPATLTRQAMTKPSQDPDNCDGLVSCGPERF